MPRIIPPRSISSPSRVRYSLRPSLSSKIRRKNYRGLEDRPIRSNSKKLVRDETHWTWSDAGFRRRADRRGRSRVGAFEPAPLPLLLPALIIFHYCEPPPRPAIVPWPGSPPLPQRRSRARSLAIEPRCGHCCPSLDRAAIRLVSICCLVPYDRWIRFRGTRRKTITRTLSSATVFKEGSR